MHSGGGLGVRGRGRRTGKAGSGLGETELWTGTGKSAGGKGDSGMERRAFWTRGV